MWARHVRTHVHDEVLSRGKRLTLGLGLRAIRLLRGFARGSVFNAEDNIEKLNQGRLGIGATAILAVCFGAAAVLIDDSVGETGFCHVLAPGKEGPDAVVEDVRVAALIHSDEKCSQLV